MGGGVGMYISKRKTLMVVKIIHTVIFDSHVFKTCGEKTLPSNEIGAQCLPGGTEV